MLLPDQFYHIYNRGNNREIIFPEARNYAYFLQLWKKHIHPIAETYAYNLLPNHFHFLIRIRPMPEDADAVKYSARLSRIFANFFSAYAKAINKSSYRVGSLFQKNFRSKHVDSTIWLERLILYIHTNAQKHRIVADFRDYSHSSYYSILSGSPTLIMRAFVLELFESHEGYLRAHANYSATLADSDRYFEHPADDEDESQIKTFQVSEDLEG